MGWDKKGRWGGKSSCSGSVAHKVWQTLAVKEGVSRCCLVAAGSRDKVTSILAAGSSCVLNPEGPPSKSHFLFQIPLT